MKHWILGGASAAALALTAGAGLSLTAEEAWESWQSASSAFGQTLTAEGKNATDGVLTLTGVSVQSDFETGSISGRIDEVILTEQGDGSVRITVSEDVPFSMTDMSDPTEKVETTAVMRHSELVALASGSQDATDFQLEAGTLSVAVVEMLVNDEPFPMTFTANAAGLRGVHKLSGPDSGTFTSEVSADSLDLNMDIAEPGSTSGSGLKLSAAVSDLESKSSGTSVELESAESPGTSLLAGMTSAGSASYGATQFDLDLREDANSVALNGTLAGGNATYAVDGDKLVYDVAYETLALAASGSSIPVPELALALARAGFQFEMPVRANDDAAPFALRIGLDDLEIDEALWSMVDPGGVLPRDPASLALDLSGTARLLMDLFDPEAMANAEANGDSVGQLETLKINDLSLSAIGAKLTSAGDFEFDNTGTQTPDGMPRPAGAVDLSLKGANTLIDNLTKIGVIPQDQIMVVRMTLGMLAKPGKEADELVSKIEITPEGQMRINGAPMPFAPPF